MCFIKMVRTQSNYKTEILESPSKRFKDLTNINVKTAIVFDKVRNIHITQNNEIKFILFIA